MPLMKFLSLWVALLALTFFRASAQIAVDLDLVQDQILPSESLLVAVRITNRSGQPLHLGVDNSWLTFRVESMDGAFVPKTAEPDVQGEFVVGSSEMATKHLDLAPYFKLTHQGNYRVTATVHIKDWNDEVASPPQPFDVIDGAKLWSQVFGMPVPAGAANPVPEVRKYTLEEANYLRSQLMMYVLVSDESGSHIFKVRSIGPMVSFSQPEAQLDRLSNLHVLYQGGARTFTYSIINPDGNFVRQETFDYYTTRPRLHTDDNGKITVLGGERRVKPENGTAIKSPLDPVASAPRKP